MEPLADASVRDDLLSVLEARVEIAAWFKLDSMLLRVMFCSKLFRIAEILGLFREAGVPSLDGASCCSNLLIELRETVGERRSVEVRG